MRFSGFCTCIALASLSTASVWAGDPTPQPSWVGKSFKSYKDIDPTLEGGSGSSIGAGEWSLEDWMIGESDEFLVLTKSSEEKGKRKVAAAQKVMPVRGKKFLFVAECTEKKSGIIVGALASKSGTKFSKIFEAWKPDTLVGKLVPVDPKSVKCHSNESIAE